MTPERWQRIKLLLHSALERNAVERSAFLDSECRDDEALRDDVESLISSHDKAGEFIESPALEIMAASLEDDLVVGRNLGPYAVSARLGAGGMGEVYLAQDTRLGRKVALKMLPAYLTVEDERVRRFQQEARAASALNHPNIITIYEIGEVDSRHFMATEFIEGETLFERLNAGSMKISDALDIAVQVVSALCAAHQAGIVHRDIKPGNIMLRADGIVKVLDFGLATLSEQKSDDLEAATLVKTKPGMVMGTAHYMSPEQARGQKMDARTDIFSLGIVLYQMVTGRVPFAGQTMTDVLAAIVMGEPPSLSESVTDAPAELHHIVHRALQKDKDARYQTAGQLLTELKGLKQRLEFEAELKRSNISRQLSSVVGPPAKSPTIESLAVLPLINASSDPNMDYFSDGVTESIINSLAQLPKLRVVARSTVFQYKGQEVAVQEVGRDLGVGALLTGRVRYAGDELMIAVELIDVTTDSQLWGEHYNRLPSDIFAVQEEIAREITAKLRIKLTGEDRRRLGKRLTENAEAYRAYLKGRYYWNKRSASELKKGIEHFRQAIDLDPSYASAYAGLSDSYTLLVVREAISPKDGFAKAKAAAEMALKIDPELSEAYASLGHALLHHWEWEAGEKELKRAIELNPGYPSAHHWYSEHLTAMGRCDESIKELKLAAELDPLSLVINADLGRAFYFARQYDQTIKQENKTLEMDSHFWLSHINLGRSYTQKEMYADAIRELQIASELSPGHTEALSYLGFAYAAAGNRDKAEQTLGNLMEQAQKSYVPPYHLAIIYAGLKQTDQAFASLEQAYERHAVDLFTLNVEPMFDQLRPEPRFTELVRRIGLGPSQAEPASALTVTPQLTAAISRSKPLEQEIRFCTTADGVRIAYATVGDGPPLVKAANWLNHLEFDWQSPIWRHLIQEFARDHFLVRYDERGNGLSDWDVENHTFEAFVQDLTTVVDSLGLDRFPILGISQGGPVAIAYAVRYPERVSHLILYGSYARGWAKRGVAEVIERWQTQKTLIKLGWGQDNPAFRQLWTTLYVPDATPEQWQWFNDLHRVSTSPDNALRLLDELGNIDVVDLLSQVKVPTLVLHCRDEVVVPFEEGRLLAAKIPGARFVPLEGRNHLLLESEPAWAKFVTEVRRFLETEQSAARPQSSFSTELIDRKSSADATVGIPNDQAIQTAEIVPAPVTSKAGEIVPAQVTTSAGDLPEGIPRRQTIVAALAAIVILLIAAVAYFSFTGRSRTIDSLAVLPFLNVSGDPNAEYLSDGIAESIIYSTSQLPHLKVMSRSSVVRYKGKDVDPQTVGRELGVSAVMTGRVDQRGDDLSISAELVDLRDNRVLWGHHYTRKIGDILAVEEEISREVSEKLRVSLTGDEQKRLSKRYTENTEAYQLYLKGRYYWNKRTADGYQKGIAHFQQAIEKDPNYALAYTGLADCYMLFGRFGVVPQDRPPEMRP